MIAGYLNYTTNTEKQLSKETAMQVAEDNQNQNTGIGDATLVNSNDVTETNDNQPDILETSVQDNNDYYIQSKLERESMYSQMLETYEKVLNSENSLETQRQSATEEINKINNIKNSIMICENLLQTKGFENSVIFVNGESVNVIIDAEEIKQEQIAQIQNIIAREMKAEIQNIHITNK